MTTEDGFPEGYWISSHAAPAKREEWDCWETTVHLHNDDGTVHSAFMLSTGAPGSKEQADCVEIMRATLKAKAWRHKRGA